MCPSDLLGNHAQRAIAMAVVFEPVLAHDDGMGVPASKEAEREAVVKAAGMAVVLKQQARSFDWRGVCEPSVPKRRSPVCR
jgi:hypothetical protein